MGRRSGAPLRIALRNVTTPHSSAPTRARVFACPQMTKVNTTFYGWSWGEVQFEWTIVGPVKTTGDEYTVGNCAAATFHEDADIRFRIGPAAALSLGVNVSAYDFQIYYQVDVWGSP